MCATRETGSLLDRRIRGNIIILPWEEEARMGESSMADSNVPVPDAPSTQSNLTENMLYVSERERVGGGRVTMSFLNEIGWSEIIPFLFMDGTLPIAPLREHAE
jgi:hypothetical protein